MFEYSRAPRLTKDPQETVWADGLRHMSEEAAGTNAEADAAADKTSVTNSERGTYLANCTKAMVLQGGVVPHSVTTNGHQT